VRSSQDARFRLERARLSLRFTCDQCAYFDDESERCVHGYPTAEHRAARYEDEEADVVFCKEWDLA
jgi:hypothetical protein